MRDPWSPASSGSASRPRSGLVAPPAPYLVNAVGQLAAFAILAVSLDLVWGYLGILSLGHGLFFAIGGYVCAMHLLAHGVAVTGVLPDFVQFMGWKSLPAYWRASTTRLRLRPRPGARRPRRLRVRAGLVRSRVNGVYFSIISQALVYVAMC